MALQDRSHDIARLHADLCGLRYVLRRRSSQGAAWHLTQLLATWPALMLSLTDEEVAAWFAYAERLMSRAADDDG